MMHKRFMSVRIQFWSVARLFASLKFTGEGFIRSLINQCRSLQAVKVFQVLVKWESYQHTNGFILNKGGLVALLKYSASVIC